MVQIFGPGQICSPFRLIFCRIRYIPSLHFGNFSFLEVAKVPIEKRRTATEKVGQRKKEKKCEKRSFQGCQVLRTRKCHRNFAKYIKSTKMALSGILRHFNNKEILKKIPFFSKNGIKNADLATMDLLVESCPDCSRGALLSHLTAT